MQLIILLQVSQKINEGKICNSICIYIFQYIILVIVMIKHNSILDINLYHVNHRK